MSHRGTSSIDQRDQGDLPRCDGSFTNHSFTVIHTYMLQPRANRSSPAVVNLILVDKIRFNTDINHLVITRKHSLFSRDSEILISLSQENVGKKEYSRPRPL